MPCPVRRCCSRAVVGRRAHDRQPGRVVDATLEGQRLERNQTLIVVHGHHGVVEPVGTDPEEAVGRERSEDQIAPTAGFFERGNDRLVLLAAQHAPVAGMRVQAEHRDLGPIDPEILNQAVVNDLDRLQNSLAGHPFRHVPDRDVAGHQSDAQVVRHHHHRVAPGTRQAGDELGMPGIFITGQRDRFFRDGCRHHGVGPAVQTELHGAPHGFHRQLSALCRDFAKFHFRRLPPGHIHHDQPLRRDPLGHLLDHLQLGERQLQHFGVFAEHFGRSDNDRIEEFHQARIGQALQHDLGPDAVRIAQRDGDPRARPHRLSAFLIYRHGPFLRSTCLYCSETERLDTRRRSL